MRPIDSDKFYLKLLDINFPVENMDIILDVMDECVVEKESNNPLTLDELREMDEEPVWVVPNPDYSSREPKWYLVDAEVGRLLSLWENINLNDTEEYKAYRYKPNGGNE